MSPGSTPVRAGRRRPHVAREDRRVFRVHRACWLWGVGHACEIS
jgi:hypothetical protein